MLEDVLDFFDYVDELRSHVCTRSFLNVAGGFWISSCCVHDFCDMLRATYLKCRISCEVCPDIVQRGSSVSYPLVVCR